VSYAGKKAGEKNWITDHQGIKDNQIEVKEAASRLK